MNDFSACFHLVIDRMTEKREWQSLHAHMKLLDTLASNVLVHDRVQYLQSLQELDCLFKSRKL